MEAKGCAKPAQWKNARRYFYWRLRARIARSRALSLLAEASPDTTPAYRSRLLDNILSMDVESTDQEVAESIEQLDLSKTLVQLKADDLIRKLAALAAEDRKATMDGLTRLANELTDDDRATLINVLQAPRSPGVFFSWYAYVARN